MCVVMIFTFVCMQGSWECDVNCFGPTAMTDGWYLVAVHSGNSEALGYAIAYRPRFVLGDFCPETAPLYSSHPAQMSNFIF